MGEALHSWFLPPPPHALRNPPRASPPPQTAGRRFSEANKPACRLEHGRPPCCEVRVWHLAAHSEGRRHREGGLFAGPAAPPPSRGARLSNGLLRTPLVTHSTISPRALQRACRRRHRPAQSGEGRREVQRARPHGPARVAAVARPRCALRCCLRVVGSVRGVAGWLRVDGGIVARMLTKGTCRGALIAG